MVVWQESGVAKFDPAYVQEFVQVPFLVFLSWYAQKKRFGRWCGVVTTQDTLAPETEL